MMKNYEQYLKNFVKEQNFPSENDDWDSVLQFDDVKLATGKCTKTKIGLSEMHKLCRKPDLQLIIGRCLKLRDCGPDGLEPDVIKEMQESFAMYRDLSFFSDNIETMCPLCINDESSNVTTSISEDESAGFMINEETIRDQSNPHVTPITKRRKIDRSSSLSPSFIESSSAPVDRSVSLHRHKSPLHVDTDVHRNVTQSDDHTIDNMIQKCLESPVSVVLEKISSPEISSHSLKKAKPKRQLLTVNCAPSFIDRSCNESLPSPDIVAVDKRKNDKITNNHKEIPKDPNESYSDFDDISINSKNTIENVPSVKSRLRTGRKGSSTTDSISASNVSRFRCAWSMDETYMIFKGVKEGRTWAEIKNVYFRHSNRTNINIKDRWRVVLVKPYLRQELEALYNSRQDK